MTAYTLALATVIPITGWAADRFGTKRLYLIVAGAVRRRLGAVQHRLGHRPADRVPGAAGPRRRHAHAARHDDHDPRRRPGADRPRDGGARRPDAARPDRRPDPRRLADRGGQLALDLPDQPADRHRRAHLRAAIVLPKDEPQPSESFDFLGMLLLSPGLALFLYGVSSIPEAGTVGRPKVLIPAADRPGAGDRVRAARAAQGPPADRPAAVQEPQPDRLGRSRMSLFIVAFMGAMLLLPSYFLQVRGETTLDAGLLMAPQGLGAMLTMPIAGRLTDKIGPGKLVLAGHRADRARHGACSPRSTADTSYVLLLGAPVRHGHGHGHDDDADHVGRAGHPDPPRQVARGSTLMNIVQQTGGSIGTAVMSVILTNQVHDSPAASAYSRGHPGPGRRPTRCRRRVLAQGPVGAGRRVRVHVRGRARAGRAVHRAGAVPAA